MGVKNREFAQHVYYKYFPNKDQRWFGYPIIKFPDDMMSYSMIVSENKPDLIIECGSGWGGSALYFAHLLDARKMGRIISIDIHHRGRRLPRHKRITWIKGSSTDDAIVAQVRAEADKCKRVMVVLDSLHECWHVRDELKKYHNMVSPGQFLVVEDTYIGGHPVRPDFGPGPWDAVEEFQRKHGDLFDMPDWCNKKLLTMNPNGWLRRKEA